MTKEEMKKALNIIVDRDVNTYFLVESCDLDEYNDYILKTIGSYYTLNQEQYDFLKEVITKIQEEVDKRGVLY